MYPTDCYMLGSCRDLNARLKPSRTFDLQRDLRHRKTNGPTISRNSAVPVSVPVPTVSGG